MEIDPRFIPRRARGGNPNFWFLIHGFWAGRESSNLGVWAATVAPKTIPKGGGRSPPPSGMVFGAAGTAQTRKIRPKTMHFKPKCIPLRRVLSAAYPPANPSEKVEWHPAFFDGCAGGRWSLGTPKTRFEDTSLKG
jgi:hypothetical protein